MKNKNRLTAAELSSEPSLVAMATAIIAGQPLQPLLPTSKPVAPLSPVNGRAVGATVSTRLTGRRTSGAGNGPSRVKTKRGSDTKATIFRLLTRPGGCSAQDVMAALDWPSVSMQVQAKRAGLELRVERPSGSRNKRYSGTPRK